MSNPAETIQTVSKIIAEQLSVRPEDITPDSTLADLGADSFDSVEIGLSLEDRYRLAWDSMDPIMAEYKTLTVAALAAKCDELCNQQ